MTTTNSATSAANAANTAADSSATANALTTLSGNFTDFLSLLTTQLQNQDPTSPMDTNQFTSELVQFTSVEQQINTNASLTSLIQATQGSEVIQATSLVGKQVTVAADQISLQNSTGTINFTTPSVEPVTISITDSNGADVKDVSGTSVAGINNWSWDGTSNSGSTVPDGVYNLTVTGTAAGAAAASIPYTVTGTATGVTNSNGSVTLQLGALSVDFSAVQNVASSSAGSGSGGSNNSSGGSDSGT